MKARRLKIRGRTWRIVIGRPPLNYCDGVCEPSTCTIYISPNKRVNRRATLIHEILHACFMDLDEPAITDAEAALEAGLAVLDTLP